MDSKQKNYKLIIQYDGTRYKGWQSLKGTERTIQGKLSAVLSQLQGGPVEVNGSGRTDAGVHALGQTASVALSVEQEPAEIMEYLNRYLPEDIAVTGLERVPDRFHARLNAWGKTYEYRVWNSGVHNVFQRKWMHTVLAPLDTDAMGRAAEILTGTHDFAAFCAAKQKKKSTVRTIYGIRITTIGPELCIAFTGNGFLHHMVRILAGTLLEVGQGIRKPEDMTEILQNGRREQAGATAPACGLILKEVLYEPAEEGSRRV